MSHQPFRKAEPTEFEAFRRSLVGRAKPVADEARVEWFDRISGMVSTVFPEQEIRSNKPGLSFKLFFFEVALPDSEFEDLEEAARELAGTWAANMPDGVVAAKVNTFPDRKDLMFEYVFDLGETYVTGCVKLRCNSFGRPKRTFDDSREDRGRRFEARGEGDSAVAEGEEGEESAEGEVRSPKRFDEEGNEKSGEYRQGRRDSFQRDKRGGGGYGGNRDNRGGGGHRGGGYGGDRDNRGGGYGGNRDNRSGGGGGYGGDRDNRGGGGSYGGGGGYGGNRDNRGGGGYGGNRDNRGGGGGYGGNRGGGFGGGDRDRAPRDDRPRDFGDRGGDRPRRFEGGDDRPREQRDFGDRGGSRDRGSFGKPGGSYGGGGSRFGRPSGGGFGGGGKKFGRPGGKFGKPGGGFKKKFGDDPGGRPPRKED